MNTYVTEQERKRREAEEAARKAAEAERERKMQEASELEAAGIRMAQRRLLKKQPSWTMLLIMRFLPLQLPRSRV